jgi:cyclic pyranopterin phosphate synthase
LAAELSALANVLTLRADYFDEPMMSTSEILTARPSVVDKFGRRLSYVRLSVTELCNLSCTYCNPTKGCGASHPYRMGWDDLDFLADVCVNDLGVEALRITGGEPTIRPGLTEWIRGLRRHPGLIDVALTTNGILLAKMAAELADAGTTRVNVSFDTFDEDAFREVTRGGNIARVLEGIAEAKRHFRRVKINAVALRDLNLSQLGRFVEFSNANEVEVRFIELMPIFDQKEFFHANYISVDELKQELARLGHVLVAEGDGAAEGNRTGYGPATTFRVEGTRARLGFISQMSNTKCLSCNKLRLTSDGALKPCLLSPNEIDMSGAIKSRNRETIVNHMRKAFLERPERYDEIIAMTESLGRSMQATGG